MAETKGTIAPIKIPANYPSLIHHLNQAHRQYVDSDGLAMHQQLLPFSDSNYTGQQRSAAIT